MNHGLFEHHQIKVEPIRFYQAQPQQLHPLQQPYRPGEHLSPQLSLMSEPSTPTCDIKDEVMSEGTLSGDGSTAASMPSAPPANKMQTCKVCGKVLSSSSSYYVHMKLHSGHKPFQCTVCEAAFCRKPYLEVHMRVHTGERPFQCDQCQKRFTQKSSLNTHKRVHTGERPYACEICDKRFAVKSYVIAHRWSHVSDRPISCDRCQMTFTSKSQYALHLRTHNSNICYECTVCGRTFAKDSYLIRHHYRAHSQDPFILTQGTVRGVPHKAIDLINKYGAGMGNQGQGQPSGGMEGPPGKNT